MESPLPSPPKPSAPGDPAQEIREPTHPPPSLLRLVPSSPRPTLGFLSKCSLRCESWKQRFRLQRKDAPDARTAVSAPLSFEEPLLEGAPASRGPGSRERGTRAKPTPVLCARPISRRLGTAAGRSQRILIAPSYETGWNYGRNVLASAAPQ